jgi:periplasmic protein TonB
MKRLLFTVAALSCLQLMLAQDAEIAAVETVYNDSIVDIKPDFPGGIENFYKVFKKEFKAPNVPGLVDKVMLSFIVEKDGTLSDVKVLHDAGFGTGEQARRILETFPKWLPGTKDGKNVRVQHQLPIAIVTEE